ncbi:MAG: ABC transporter ATP-binding protein [Opitutia bacterium Tous-C8FEB]|nr:MAG: ABC transporter ATP-binding protein [Opitutae bacterium Tous-C8FEB]
MEAAASVPAVAPALETRGLVKDFPVGLRGVKLRAVDHLDLTVPAGMIYGLLGPNGSGKSTTIKALLGLVAPSAGECRIFGQPSGEVGARREVGYLPEAPYFYRHLTGRELVGFYGRMCGLGRRELAGRVETVVAQVGMTAAADRAVETYSKGMLQRIGLAQALVHDPRLLILDEPTAGVDPVGSAAMADLIRSLRDAGKTVLLTSHLLGQMEALCDRVAILDRGRLVAEGTVAELAGGAGRHCLEVDRLDEPQLAELRAWLAARGRGLHGVTAAGRGLDAVFLERVGRGQVEGREP